MKLWYLLLAAGGSICVGGAMFLASFYQSQSPELISPYSTQAVLVVRSVPEPWKFLLRWGGGGLALVGGTGFTASAVSKIKPKLETFPFSLSPGVEEISDSQLSNDEDFVTEKRSQIPPSPQPQSPQPQSPPVPPQTLQTLKAKPYPVPNQSAAKQEDILVKTAKFGSDPAEGGHILIACLTNTGKSSSVLRMIEVVASSGQAAEWHVIDPKGSAWMGLELCADKFGHPLVVDVNVDNPVAIPAAVATIDAVLAELTRRKPLRRAAQQSGSSYRPTPYILILDEWPTLLKAARDYDASFPLKDSPRTREKLIQKVETLVFIGREDGIFVWIVSQSPYVSQLGFDGSVRNQFAILSQCLGRNSKSLKPVRDAIADCAGEATDSMHRQLSQMARENPEHPICFSSLGDVLVFAPDLKGIKTKRLFQPSAPDGNPLRPLQEWVEEQGLQF